MDMPNDADLLKQVETFLAKTKMAPTRFGRDTMGEASLVASMREGRSLSLRNANKLVQYMADYVAPAVAEQAAAA